MARLAVLPLLAATLGVAPSAAIEWNSPAEWNRLKLARSRSAAGEQLLEKGQFEQAEEAFRKAIHQHAELPISYLGLGAALVGQQRFGEALDVLHEAEQRYVAWHDELQMAALIHRQQNAQRRQELTDLLKAVQGGASTSNPTPSPRARAITQQLQNEIARTQTARNLGDRLQPEEIQAIPSQVFYLEGISHLRSGQRERGIQSLETCLLLNGSHGLAHYNLAVARFTRGELEESRQHLDVAVELGVEPPERFVRDLNRSIASRGDLGSPAADRSAGDSPASHSAKAASSPDGS